MTYPTTTPQQNAALTFCSDIHFHRSIHLPATSDHETLRVTFATTTNFDDGTLPVALFCTPMGASRLLVFEINHVAEEKGVRVIFIDRPGFGGSTPVALDIRVKVWLESVPAVLEKLDVGVVSLISHSAGCIYLLNTLVQLPQILDPSTPYAAVLTPWVHPDHSSAPMMNLVDKLPSSWIGNFHHIQNFVGASLASSMQLSGGAMEMLQSKTEGVDDEKSKRLYGVDKKTWDEVQKLQGRFFRLEDTSGVSAEALLCMRKTGDFWDACNDLPHYISTLISTYKGLNRKLTLRASFSETDRMIGKGGQAYFEKCWREADVRDTVNYTAEVADGTDHESIVLAEKGCVGKILGEIRGRQ